MEIKIWWQHNFCTMWSKSKKISEKFSTSSQHSTYAKKYYEKETAVLTVNKDSDQGKGYDWIVKEIVIYEKKICTYMYRSCTITPKREWKTARQNCINDSILQVPLCYTLKVQNNIMEFFLCLWHHVIYM